MRNVAEVVEAARGKPILFFPARHDHWLVQTGDGWAAHVAGAIGVSTDAQASWWGGRGVGTVPHARIAAYGGDTVRAARAWADRCADAMNVTVLVDFDNDSLRTALEVAADLGDRLWGVRLDTSEALVDVALAGSDRHGVVPELVVAVREALDGAGHAGVYIVVSGGFDAAKIRAFGAADVPVDAYGVGSSLLRGANDFTADVVEVDGRPCAKVGRGVLPSDRPRARRLASAAVLARIDHVGIAVTDLDAAIALYERDLAVTLVHRETVAEQGVDAVLLDVGENHVELLAPLADDTPVGKFLAKKGPGLHHVAYQTPDIEAELARLKDAGLRLIDETPRTGIRGSSVAFLHPSSSGGVLTEIVQPAEDH